MNISKIACAVALVLGSSQLSAQQATATAGSAAGAQSDSRSMSLSQGGTGTGYGGTGISGASVELGNTSASSSSGASGASVQGLSTSFDYRSSVTDNSSHTTNYDLSKSVPSMWAPGLGGGGSNPCVVSLSAAGVGSGFGFSLGKSYNDKECQVREHLRVVGGQLQQGSKQAQVFQKNVACQSDMLRESLEISARESGEPSMRCAASFYPGGRYPEERNRRAAKPASRSVAVPAGRQASAPASKGGYIEAVNRCKSVPDSAFASCMRQARSKL